MRRRPPDGGARKDGNDHEGSFAKSAKQEEEEAEAARRRKEEKERKRKMKEKAQKMKVCWSFGSWHLFWLLPLGIWHLALGIWYRWCRTVVLLPGLVPSPIATATMQTQHSPVLLPAHKNHNQTTEEKVKRDRKLALGLSQEGRYREARGRNAWRTREEVGQQVQVCIDICIAISQYDLSIVKCLSVLCARQLATPNVDRSDPQILMLSCSGCVLCCVFLYFCCCVFAVGVFRLLLLFCAMWLFQLKQILLLHAGTCRRVMMIPRMVISRTSG